MHTATQRKASTFLSYKQYTIKDHSIGLFRRDPGSTAEPLLEAAFIGTLLDLKC